MKGKIEDLVRKNIKNLKAYSSARNEFDSEAKIFLDANENPFGGGLNRYPDTDHQQLKANISKQFGVQPNQLLLGNGSDDVLDLIFRTFCVPGHDNIVIVPPTYGMYKVIADINDVNVREAYLTNNFELDVDAVIQETDENTKMVVLCSPNNPSGNTINEDDIGKLLNQLSCIIVIDEAYIEFSLAKSWCGRLPEFPNLVISRTLSKAWGLAGIRLGIGIASSYIISMLYKVKPPYNVNALTEQKALEVLENTALFESNRSKILNERQKLNEALGDLKFVEKIYPSDANFLLIKVHDADAVYNFLRDNGVIVRNRSNQPGCFNMLRITIGNSEENKLLINTLKNFMP